MSHSLESFEKQLDIHQSCAPCWYSTGHHCLNIFHAQLNMLCSPLNGRLHALICVLKQSVYACGLPLNIFPLTVFSSNDQNQMITELNRLDFELLLNNLLYGNAYYYVLCGNNPKKYF